MLGGTGGPLKNCYNTHMIHVLEHDQLEAMNNMDNTLDALMAQLESLNTVGHYMRELQQRIDFAERNADNGRRSHE